MEGPSIEALAQQAETQVPVVFVVLWQLCLRHVWWLWQMTVAVVMAPRVSHPSTSAQTVLDLFKVHVGAKLLASARAKAGQWFDCSTDKERYIFG